MFPGNRAYELRPAHYGLTGGLFLLTHLCLFVFFIPSELISDLRLIMVNSIEVNNIDYLVSMLSKSGENERWVICAIILIFLCFFIGLGLDLVGSYAVFWEAKILATHLKRHQVSLTPILCEISRALITDLEEVIAVFADFGNSARSRSSLRSPLAFWRRAARQLFIFTTN